MNKLTQYLQDNAMEYGSIPFWSWNDKLEEGELRRQIRNMHDLTMRGFFMHARGGLETEYLSEEWYDAVRACIDEAKRLGMQAWAYDENGWPSGFAGGKLLENPDYHAVYVEGTFTETFPTQAPNTLAVYAIENGQPRRTGTPTENAQRYLHVTVGTDDSYVDTMRTDVTDAFIQATHEAYERVLGKDFGCAAMPGFFTDEPQYYRWSTPYSKHMDAWFRESYGYSVLDALPALFMDYEGACEHRYDYHRMTCSKFIDNFAKRIYTWAEAHGVQITGHYVEENTLDGQMMCCGDIMAAYPYEHIPGIDYLGRSLSSDIASHQLGSVCAQLGRSKALSEMFACCGWDVSPRELKHIAELQYAGGVNVMCQHLYPYSIRGQRKRDYPAFYSEHSLWQKQMVSFNEYFNHLGCALAMGEPCVDVLVIHPIHSAWLTFQRVHIDTSVRELNRAFEELCYRLSDAQIMYHFGCERIMAEIAHVKGDVLQVGRCSYKTVILPVCDTLDGTTVALLKEFQQNGGRILTYRQHTPTRMDGRIADLSCFCGLPDVADDATLTALKNDASVTIQTDTPLGRGELRSMVRTTPFGRLIYLTNLSESDIETVHVSVKNCKNVAQIDIQSLQFAPVCGACEGDTAHVVLRLCVGESALLVEQDDPAMLPREALCAPCTIRLTEAPVATALPLNLMPLDRAHITRDDGIESACLPLERIRDELLSSRYNGPITLSFPFAIQDVPEVLQVISEPMASDTLNVNGHTVAIGTDHAIDRSFRVTDIAPYLVKGENRVSFTIPYTQSEYVYHVLYGGVSETLRNCLVFDTEIENLYLRGSFSLSMKQEDFTQEGENVLRYDPKNGMALIRQSTTPDIRNLVTDGYPFFCGSMTFATTLSYQTGDPTVLALRGRFATCEVKVNGHEAGCALFSPYLDIAEHLVPGENVIELTLTNNYRNLLGPHHYTTAEPAYVSPPTFSFEKMWHDGQCDAFDPRYALLRFGLDL